ncbi:MAG: mechanosensitive ion channel family protein [Bacteroidota bacterium]
MRLSFLPFIFLGLFGAGIATNAFAQSDSTRTPTVQPGEFSQANPQEAVTRHLHYLQRNSYEPELAATVIYGELELEEKIHLASQIKDLFDAKGDYINTSLIPDDPQYKDSLSGQPIYVVQRRHFPQIYLKKYGNAWYYSAETVRELPSLYQRVIPPGANLLQRITKPWGQRHFLLLKIWQWIGLLVVAGLVLLSYAVLDRLLAYFAGRLLPRLFPDSEISTELIPRAVHPLSYLGIVFLLRQYFVPMLILPIEWSRPVSVILIILASVFGVLFFYRLIDVLASVFKNLASRTETTMDDQLVPLLTRGAKLIVIVFGILFVLDNLDVNVTALLAGVSIGGLALALAAQDTVRNFLGSITIFVDRPFAVGDFVEFGGVSGSVTEVGVRSTRIRAADGAYITVPNGDLANKIITNHSIRTYRRYATSLTVTYDTLPEQMEHFVAGVKKIVVDHPQTQDDSAIIQFHEMSASSLDIFFAAIFNITAYDEWLAARQEILLEIMKLATEMKIGFAFPSQSVYIESMPEVPNPSKG